MKQSRIFKLAHAFAKNVKQSGDSYSACFAIALKEIYAILKNVKACVKGGIAQNGKPYVQVKMDDAKALIGKAVSVSESLIVGGIDVSPRRGRRAGKPLIRFIKQSIELSSMGNSFYVDNVEMVRMYGESKQIIQEF